MENAYWEHNLADNSYRFVLANNVRLTVQQVRDSLAAMQGINSPNPLYEALVKAATDFTTHQRAATEQRARQEQAQQRSESVEDILRKAAESMSEDMLRRAYQNFGFGGARFGFGAGGSQERAAQPPPRPSTGKRHWKEVLGFHVNQHVQRHDAKSAYKRKAMEVHQNHDGDSGAMHDDMVALNVAKREFELELGK